MPVVSMFYGIIIYMYFSDNEKHNEPHVHIRYSGTKAVVSVNSGKILSGQLDNKPSIYRIEPLK